jgi:hypothetical protein
MTGPLIFITSGLLGVVLSKAVMRRVRPVWVRYLLDALLMGGGAVAFAWRGLWFPAVFFTSAAALFLWMASRS